MLLRDERSRWGGIRTQAAVAVVLRGPPEERAVLLIQRAQRAGDPWSGDISLPGGRRQPEDADLVATARRETREEVGLDLTDAALLGWLPGRLTRAHRQRRPMAVHPAVFSWPAGVATGERCSAEATAAFWVPLAALRDPASATTRPWRIGPVTLPAPAWRVEGRVIWGLTHRILVGVVG
jgi:8-oxo-dGTP pyrophosphatase MutT (NUDIX family)